MSRSWLLAPMLIALLLARPASATDGHQCCACVVNQLPDAMTAQAAPVADVLFCGVVSMATQPDFKRDCQNAGGSASLCVDPPSGNQTCSEILLEEEGLTCPAPSPAPAASDWGLTALALALSGFGIAAMRRRVR